MKKAIEYFEQAIAKDPSFSLAYVALSDSHLNDQERRGLKTFVELRCTLCHSGPLLKGEVPADYVKEPRLPASGPATPGLGR